MPYVLWILLNDSLDAFCERLHEFSFKLWLLDSTTLHLELSNDSNDEMQKSAPCDTRSQVMWQCGPPWPWTRHPWRVLEFWCSPYRFWKHGASLYGFFPSSYKAIIVRRTIVTPIVTTIYRAYIQAIGSKTDNTPQKTNMEPENHPKMDRTMIFQTFIFGFNMLLFEGWNDRCMYLEC